MGEDRVAFDYVQLLSTCLALTMLCLRSLALGGSLHPLQYDHEPCVPAPPPP